MIYLDDNKDQKGQSYFRRWPECFVVESGNHDPNYYPSKRITWIEKHNIIDPHEEQFHREGQLSKIIDKEWKPIKDWNYWVRMRQYYYRRQNHRRDLPLVLQSEPSGRAVQAPRYVDGEVLGG